MSTPPAHADETVHVPGTGRDGRALAVIPLASGNGYRVPVRFLTDDGDDEPDPLATATVLYVNGSDPQLLPHPFDWTTSASPPLACEVRTQDVLLPAPGVPGRRPANAIPGDPSAHGDYGATPMVVVSVRYVPEDDVVQVVTRDGDDRLRRYRRPPEDVLDMTRPYDGRRRPRTVARAAQPEVFVGPFVSRTGAQWVFQERSGRGGSLPRNTPRFDPYLPPQFHPETGDLVPYVAVAGKRDVYVGVWRSVHTFSPTARRMPEVQYILRAHGIPVDES